MAIYDAEVGVGVLRDFGLLDGAVCAPFQDVFGVEVYPSLAQKAGKLLDGIQRAQAYSDGSKRLAWLATNTFVEMNGQLIRAVPDEEVDEFVRGLNMLPAPEVVAAVWLNDRMVLIT